MEERRPHEPGIIAATYLRHHRYHDDADFWAFDQAHGYLLGGETELAWDVLLALVRQAEAEDLGYVAAGLLEEISRYHGLAFVGRIEERATADPKFKEALGLIWLNRADMPPDVLRRLVEASGGVLVPMDVRDVT